MYFFIFVPMNEQVIDIYEIIRTFTNKLDALQSDLDTVRVELTVAQEEIRVLKYENVCLKVENKELKKRLDKYEKPSKASHNSSIPPGKEDFKSETIRRTKSLREKSDRPIGGQLNHKGYTRKMVSAPDEVMNHVSQYCTNCGCDLSGVDAILEDTTQEIDLQPIETIVKEHRHYVRSCTCGCKNRSSLNRIRGGNKMVFGKNIQSLVVYLNIVQCVPYERLQSALKTIFNIDISQGSIRNIIVKTKKEAQKALVLIKNHISESKVVGFDESGCFCHGILNWSWIAQTPLATFVFIAKNRSGKVLEQKFGKALENMIAVTDRHQTYFSLDFKNHQICLAHILRELQYLNDVDSTQDWSKRMQELLREAIHTRNQNPTKSFDTKPWIARLNELLSQNVSHLKDCFEALRKGIMKRRLYVFPFLENPAIPATNNASERGFRKIKIKQKISGTFRSDICAEAFMDLHSILDTAWKNKQNQLSAILALK